MSALPGPKVLCVDDEPAVLDGLSLSLERRFSVLTANSGAEALLLLEREPNIAVVISDMRMPLMDGAKFLSRARVMVPHVVRVLLTGHTDLPAAISVVNEGQIFRFLTKPCAPASLLSTVEAAVEQNRLVLAEKELLEKTLQGSLQALTDVLALTTPVLFGRATRHKQRASELARKMKHPAPWQVEVAAMVFQLGYVTLSADLLEKLYEAQPLSTDELALLDAAGAFTQQMLSHIPRLEGVRELLACYRRPRAGDGARDSSTLGAAVLRVVVDYDALKIRGASKASVFETLEGRGERYQREVVAAFKELLSTPVGPCEKRELPVRELRAGMVCLNEVRTTSGALLAPRGYQVTAGFVERVRHLSEGTVREPIAVRVPVQ